MLVFLLDGNSVEYTDKGEVIVIEAYAKYEDGLLSDAAQVCIPILLIFF